MSGYDYANNPEGSYLARLDDPNPCDMGRERNDVQHASRWNRVYRAIEKLCERNTNEALPCIELCLDGSGSPIATGYAGHLVFPSLSLTIVAWQILVEPAGTIVLDLWKNSFGDGALSVADSICPAGKPQTAAAVEARLLTVPAWSSLSISPGDKIGVNVDSNDVVTKVTLGLVTQRVWA